MPFIKKIIIWSICYLPLSLYIIIELLVVLMLGIELIENPLRYSYEKFMDPRLSSVKLPNIL